MATGACESRPSVARATFAIVVSRSDMTTPRIETEATVQTPRSSRWPAGCVDSEAGTRAQLRERAKSAVLALEVRMVPPASFLRPSAGGCRRVHRQHLPSPRSLEHARGPVPFLGDHEQGRPSGPPSAQAKQPRSSSTVCQHLATLADAHAPLVRDVGVPDGVLGVGTDAVRDAIAELGPDPPVRQAAVGRDVERRQPPSRRTRRRSASGRRA